MQIQLNRKENSLWRVVSRLRHKLSFTAIVQHLKNMYRNDPKFSARQVWANSVDPVQTAPLHSDS